MDIPVGQRAGGGAGRLASDADEAPKAAAADRDSSSAPRSTRSTDPVHARRLIGACSRNDRPWYVVESRPCRGNAPAACDRASGRRGTAIGVTAADWTGSERNVAMRVIMRLVGRATDIPELA